jgi:hypothetical protein
MNRSFSHEMGNTEFYGCDMTNELMGVFLQQPDSIVNYDITNNIIRPLLGMCPDTNSNNETPKIFTSLLACYLAYSLGGQSSDQLDALKQLKYGGSTLEEIDGFVNMSNSHSVFLKNFKQLGSLTVPPIFQQCQTNLLSPDDNRIVTDCWTGDPVGGREFNQRLKHGMQFAFISLHCVDTYEIFRNSVQFTNGVIFDGLRLDTKIDHDPVADAQGHYYRNASKKMRGRDSSKYFKRHHAEEGDEDEFTGDWIDKADDIEDEWDFVIVRPNIEHNMLGVVMGRGGKDELGATFWGQTELSCYDDGMHGKWGMSYKYHERAMVLNEKNLIKCWDVAFNGYNGGMDDTHVSWTETNESFQESTTNLSEPYSGDSMLIMRFRHIPGKHWPNPILLSHEGPTTSSKTEMPIDPENIHSIFDWKMAVFSAGNNDTAAEKQVCQRYMQYAGNPNFPDFARLHRQRKPAGYNAQESLTEATSLAFQGTSRVNYLEDMTDESTKGAGHLGQSYVGVASVREGKGLFWSPGANSMMKMF